MRSRFTTLFILVSALTLISIAPAQTENNLPEIIKKVMTSTKKLRYFGVRTVLLRFGPDQQRHVEIVKRAGGKTRIEFPDEGSFHGQIIVENENERRHYIPDKNQIEILPPRRDELLGRWDRMGKRGPKFVFNESSGETVAGIATREVEIGAANGPVFQRIWVDPRTGLILKRELYDPQGKVQASSEYTKVDYTPSISRNDFVLNIPGAKVITPRDRLAELLGKGDFANVSLSPKDPLRLESCRIQRIGNAPALVQDYVNKNGRVTLFQLRTGLDADRLRRFGRGEVRAYSWQRGGSTYVLLGTFDEAALREIAQRLGG